MPSGIIKISRNSTAIRIFFFTQSMFPSFLTLVYLFWGSHQLIDITVGLAIIIINILLSRKLAFNDYEVWLDTNEKKVLIKRKKEVDEYPLNEFCKFRIAYYGMFLSNVHKFYRLNIGGRKYRIRIYTNRLDKVTDVLDPSAVVKSIEEEIRRQVCNA